MMKRNAPLIFIIRSNTTSSSSLQRVLVCFCLSLLAPHHGFISVIRFYPINRPTSTPHSHQHVPPNPWRLNPSQCPRHDCRSWTRTWTRTLPPNNSLGSHRRCQLGDSPVKLSRTRRRLSPGWQDSGLLSEEVEVEAPVEARGQSKTRTRSSRMLRQSCPRMMGMAAPQWSCRLRQLRPTNPPP